MPVPTFRNIGEGMDVSQLSQFVHGHIRNLNDFLAHLDTLNIDELHANVIIARSITADKIAVDTITANEIAANAITASEINANAVTADKIQANAVTTDKINAGAVTADKITVEELSAISADVGHITAGLIESIQMVSSIIIGSEIMTRVAGSYPRAYMSSSEDLFSAEASADEFIRMVADYFGQVSLLFSSTSMFGQIRPFGDLLFINTDSGSGGIQVSSGGDLELYADILDSSKKVYVNSWSRFVNDDTKHSLQQDLDSLQNQINSLQNQQSNMQDDIEDLEDRVSALEVP